MVRHSGKERKRNGLKKEVLKKKEENWESGGLHGKNNLRTTLG